MCRNSKRIFTLQNDNISTPNMKKTNVWTHKMNCNRKMNMTPQNRKILIFFNKTDFLHKNWSGLTYFFWAPMTLLLMLVNVYEHYVWMKRKLRSNLKLMIHFIIDQYHEVCLFHKGKNVPGKKQIFEKIPIFVWH